MNRNITNIIRFFLDECIPPILRDNRWFMYPFYCFAYRFKNLETVMDFKKVVYSFTDGEYVNFYQSLCSISTGRESDLTHASSEFLTECISAKNINILDVGSGNGFLLRLLHEKKIGKRLVGVDINLNRETQRIIGYSKVQASIMSLPFGDNSFDTVICTHTLEHVLDLRGGVAELKRVAKKQLIIIVPCQRYYYYTLDEHINFFGFPEQIMFAMGLENALCEKKGGDWIIVHDM